MKSIFLSYIDNDFTKIEIHNYHCLQKYQCHKNANGDNGNLGRYGCIPGLWGFKVGQTTKIPTRLCNKFHRHPRSHCSSHYHSILTCTCCSLHGRNNRTPLLPLTLRNAHSV